MQGTKYCGEAIHLNRAEWCRIEGNRLYATGGNGIYLQGYNARNMIRRNEIAYVGGNGVGLGGAWGFGDSMNADATPAHDHDLGLAESHLQYPLFNEISITTSTTAARSSTTPPACLRRFPRTTSSVTTRSTILPSTASTSAAAG